MRTSASHSASIAARRRASMVINRSNSADAVIAELLYRWFGWWICSSWRVNDAEIVGGCEDDDDDIAVFCRVLWR